MSTNRIIKDGLVECYGCEVLFNQKFTCRKCPGCHIHPLETKLSREFAQYKTESEKRFNEAINANFELSKTINKLSTLLFEKKSGNPENK